MLQLSAAFLSPARPRALARWLLAVAAMIVGIVVVGGITRLTNSGLSITEWKPLTGIIPPLNEAQWQAEFANYRRIPEYQQFNRGMTLGGFQAIFFWEWLHRALARTIGMVFALPLLWFWVRKQIPAGYKPRLVALLALGGLQGAVGWWMVQSGLAVRTDVSHIRLAVHLGVALLTLAGIVWTALDLYRLHHEGRARPARMTGVGALALLLLAVQIIWGAFTAGLDAGFAFASWPLMGDNLYPAGAATVPPLANAIDNPVAVQFVHRWFAFVAAAGLVWLAVRAWRVAPRSSILLVGLVVLQIVLGIATLLSGVQIDVAVTHQANAALLLVAAVSAAHALGRASTHALGRASIR
jgi:cytochrome c oxidase assembly protein subunit 15